MPSNENDNDTLPFLGPDDPDPVEVHIGDSPIIFAGPHNGFAVPKSLYDDHDKPLGIHPSVFDEDSPFRRHEACDWGMAPLFEALHALDKKSGVQHNYIEAHYSRLVCDLNREPKLTMEHTYAEAGNVVPGNLDLSPAQRNIRLKAIHEPYHDALYDLMKQTQKKYGYFIFIDLHSFTPHWKGEKRETHIGTLSLCNHFIDSEICKHLKASCDHLRLNFMPHSPYDLRTKKDARLAYLANIMKDRGDFYLGLEARNDLLEYDENIQNIAKIIREAAQEADLSLRKASTDILSQSN